MRAMCLGAAVGVIAGLTAGLTTVLSIAGTAFGQAQSVVDTTHNLSAGGPGLIRATTEPEVCIFCHTPHSVSEFQPLWNRQLPASAYTVYGSSSLDAEPGQPTGSSKMCLSCHDGTIALGSVLSRGQSIQMSGGITTLPPGAGNLGTDLTDDHPISFRYDNALAGQDDNLLSPLALPQHVQLDANQELQCTTCHDPHDNSFGQFLVIDNSNSTLCLSCHNYPQSTIRGHENCNSCHSTHSAPSGPYLLKGDRISTTCLSCHDGSQAGAHDILSDMSKFSVHDTNTPVSTEPSDRPYEHVTCTDCHDPHTMETGGPTAAPAVSPTMGRIAAVSSSGGQLQTATFEYQVCFRCHGNQSPVRPTVPRVITPLSTRLEFASAVSYHPVVTAGRNPAVPSLKPGWTTGSVIGCTDCHGSDTSKAAGGNGANGPHGSNEEPLLLERYVTLDFTPESPQAYALCYRCHWRETTNGILADRTFPHSVHVVDSRTPCSACHSAHGISSAQGTSINNSHLINFDSTIAFPDPLTGRLEYQDMGLFAGSCTLSCHGVVHSRQMYQQ